MAWRQAWQAQSLAQLSSAAAPCAELLHQNWEPTQGFLTPQPPTFTSSADLSTEGHHTTLVCSLQTVLRLPAPAWGIGKGPLGAQGPTHLKNKIVISLRLSQVRERLTAVQAVFHTWFGF